MDKTDFGLFEEESTIQISRRPYLLRKMSETFV